MSEKPLATKEQIQKAMDSGEYGIVQTRDGSPVRSLGRVKRIDPDYCLIWVYKRSDAGEVLFETDIEGQFCGTGISLHDIVAVPEKITLYVYPDHDVVKGRYVGFSDLVEIMSNKPVAIVDVEIGQGLDES